MVGFVDYQGLGAGGQDLEGLQELDDRVAVVFGEGLEGLGGGEGFAGVGEHGLAEGGEEAVMEVERLVGAAPEALGEGICDCLCRS